MRLMGLDYGSKTVGVSAVDALGITVVPVETIWRKEENKLRRTCARIEELIKEMNIGEIVLGLPLNMDGTEGERAKNARAFAAMIERRTGLKVILHDERLTTIEADEILAENGVAKSDRKKTLDQVAAVLILEDYLNGRNGNDNFHG
ncbi:MAG: Holliday junction resolvase RuvX [Lachnospiraceae bacterium]|nr:Holliday junction resolvase RuvX [Lachnospiraceae bacterium]MBQ3968792.1 Holliday junction resolvase RuvX [Lachnospiraceae bacterium]MBR4588970.1 Holliday junction resolvase RuvX [Lachnospiraceae bacterium]